MAAEYLEHRTSEGDRWDLLAYEYYGDPLAYERIIRANPDVSPVPILPGGLVLKIPIIDQQTTLSGQELPPWKR